ncbi:MAG: 30S ribosomal protein S20 [Candidatus Omnitrophota bacterium]|nr:30S ribosomal protein S20 [Candidatus Omnitrophota bacterium]HLD88193.1 30S ribosomal protein S20 [Candidatus Omnitrophota bacterium]
MPQRRTAVKDLRKNRTRHMRNLDIKTDLKKTVKKFLSAVKDKKSETQELLKVLYRKMDKAAKRNILHKKTAARRKSRFAKLLVK